MKRFGSTVPVLICLGALCAGCASASHSERPPVSSEPSDPGADGAAALDEAGSQDPAALEEAELPDPTAPTSTARSDQAADDEDGAEVGPHDSQGGDSDEAVPAQSEGDAPSQTSVFPAVVDGAGVANWTVEIVESVPHDPDAFTQGLEVADGIMYESTGLRGRSSLRAVDAGTGEVTAQVDLADEFFGEGLTVVGDRILQLTWQSGTALVYDRSTLETVGEHSYEGEGWGLCAMDGVLIMSNGSDRLARRDPRTFELLGTVTVTASGYEGRLDYLNELECVDGLVISNVWQTDNLLVIDPESGGVVAAVDAQPLVDDVLKSPSANGVDVLNGVAVDDGTATLWMTGKLWPRLYRVRIVEVP